MIILISVVVAQQDLKAKGQEPPIFGQVPAAQKSPREVCWIHKEQGHPIWKCEEFQSMSVPQRIELTAKNKACGRCLY